MTKCEHCLYTKMTIHNVTVKIDKWTKSITSLMLTLEVISYRLLCRFNRSKVIQQICRITNNNQNIWCANQSCNKCKLLICHISFLIAKSSMNINNRLNLSILKIGLKIETVVHKMVRASADNGNSFWNSSLSIPIEWRQTVITFWRQIFASDSRPIKM